VSGIEEASPNRSALDRASFPQKRKGPTADHLFQNEGATLSPLKTGKRPAATTQIDGQSPRFYFIRIPIVGGFSGLSAYLSAYQLPRISQTTRAIIAGKTGDDLMRQIPPGTKGTFTLRVQPEYLANQFKDAMLPQVLATPVMIMAMENAALNAMRPFLEPGESAVGTEINVRHLAATPAGHRVRAEAEVVSTLGKRILFKVSASDETDEIGNGTHQRTVINLQSFNEHLAKKRKY
jgi:fluoroacetyl-CoA thioesterase